MQNIDIVKWVMCKTDLLFSSSLVEQSLVKNSCSISSHSVHFNCFYDKCIVFVTSLITWHSIAIHDMSHDSESIDSPIVITGLWLVYVCAEPPAIPDMTFHRFTGNKTALLTDRQGSRGALQTAIVGVIVFLWFAITITIHISYFICNVVSSRTGKTWNETDQKQRHIPITKDT